MTDEADQASDREEKDREEAISRRRPEAPPACGACLFCGEALTGNRRWCDQDCRDDWQRRTRRIDAGGAIGGAVGARVARGLAGRRGVLNVLFAALIFVVAIYVLWRAGAALGMTTQV